MGVGRHERSVEGTLGKNRAEMVGQAERDEECVGHGARAENRRQHDVTGKAGQSRQQRVGADGEDAPEHAPSYPIEGIFKTTKSG